MSDNLALLFGVAIILFYSYDRFNIATYQGDARLDRLVSLISPDKLRARGTVLKAYAFYAFMLVSIFLFLCAYAEILPALGGPSVTSKTLGASQLPAQAEVATRPIVTGFAPLHGGSVSTWAQQLTNAGDQQDRGIGISPSVSLAIALVVVGLAPTFPLLKRFDEWMRSVAHRLAGIPTWILEASDALRGSQVGEKNLRGAPLISRSDRERLEKFRKVSSKTPLENDDGFWSDLTVIVAISSWILEDKVKLSGSSARSLFTRLEKTLIDRKEGLIHQLDGIIASGGFGSPAAPLSDERELEAEVPRQQGTGQIEKVVDDLAVDCRILVALYVEHGVIDFDTAGESAPVARANQQDQAKAALRAYAEAARGEPTAAYYTTYATSVWLWTLGITLSIALIWSITLGGYETILQRAVPRPFYWRMLNYVFFSFNVYCLTLLIALAIRDGLRHKSASWHGTLALGEWTRWLPQLFGVAAASWAGAMMFLVGVSIWQYAIRVGWDKAKDSLGDTITGSVEYNAPTALRGALMALIVLVLLDRRQAEDPGGRGDQGIKTPSSLRWAVSAAAIMFIAGIGTRLLSSFAGGSLSEIDGELTGLMLYAALHSALVGFFVVFCVSEMLLFKMRARRDALPVRSGPSHNEAG